jgi:hypothetical protein
MKSSWRANDIMWGRLDGISQLLQCVATPERVRVLESRGYDFPAAVAGFDLQAMFPNSKPELVRALQQDLSQLPVYAREHLTQPREDGVFSRFEQFQDCLIRAAQSEIVEQEIPRVMDMAIQQQIRWNQYKRVPDSGPPFRPDTQSWTVGSRKIDRAVLSVAGSQLVKMREHPEPGQWTEFLVKGYYGVATESLSDGIPKPVVLEIATQSALVLQNCITGVTGMKRADAIRANSLFRFGVSYPLRAVYGFAVFQRSAPEFARSISVAILALSVAALAAGIAWWPDLIHTRGNYHLMPFLILIVAPVLALLAQISIYGRLRSFRLWLLAAAVVFLATLGMIDAGMIGGKSPGVGALSDAINWLHRHSASIWIGAAAAFIGTIPFRALWREIQVRLYDWRHRRAARKVAPKPVAQPLPQRAEAAEAGRE